MLAPGPVGPFNIELYFLLESRMGQLRGNPLDGLCGDACFFGDFAGRVLLFKVTHRHQLESRASHGAIRHFEQTAQFRHDVRQQGVDCLALVLFPGQRIAFFIAQEQAIFRVPFFSPDQPGRVAVANQEVEVNLS